jgi:uncharacterized protein YndB with AHSA1/START domain
MNGTPMHGPSITDAPTITTGPGEFTYTRVLSAPRDLVFRCMTTPEHLTRFWGPTGTSTPLEGITVDLRPGGSFETLMVADDGGGQHHLRAVFVEIVEPERLVWTERDGGITSTTTFVDLGDGRTEVTIHQTNLPTAYLAPESLAGFATSIDRFVAYLATVEEAR